MFYSILLIQPIKRSNSKFNQSNFHEHPLASSDVEHHSPIDGLLSRIQDKKSFQISPQTRGNSKNLKKEIAKVIFKKS